MSRTSVENQGDARLKAALDEVGAAVRAKDMAQATALARQSLDAGVEHPALLNLRSLWHEEQGRLQEALADLLRAEALAPRDFSVKNAKGILLARLQRSREAAAAFDEAVTLEPRFAQALHNRGWAREAIGDLVGARESYEQALALKPDYADPLAHLAALAARRGDANRARIHAQQALRIDPHQSRALIALAEAERIDGEMEQAEARLRSVIARSDGLPMDLALAQSQLGDVLDAEGRYAEAFDAYAAGNAGLKQLYAPLMAEGRSQGVPQMLLWLIEYFSKASPAAWRRRPTPSADAAGGTAAHVFMIGFPRSGTTLLENVLAAHPSVVTLEEQDTFSESVRDFMADADDLNVLSRASEESLDAYRRAYWRRVREAGLDPSGKVFVDKLPLNTIKLPLIVKLFPDAKVVFSLRDPRDVVLSCFRRRFHLNASMYEFLTLEGSAVFYDLVMRFGLICLEKFELATGFIRYEDLVEDFEKQTRAICSFLGVEWSESMAAFSERARTGLVATPSAAQVAKGLYGDAVGKWRAYEPQMAPARQFLDPWADRFGYPQ
jgi:tetratricopeptide (TPR) repeat protein